ncbi:MAG: NuoM family protein [Actinomycetota bacterium]
MRWLSLVTFLPVAGVAALLLVRRLSDGAARVTALGVSLATFVASLGLLAAFDPAADGYQLVERATWFRTPHVEYLLGVDGVSLFLVLLTTFLVPIAILASWNVGDRVRLYLAAILALETATIGAFLALDLLLFFLFFEALLFPMYLLIGSWGYGRRVYAAGQFLLFTMAGSAFLLVAILVLYRASGVLPDGPTFDVRALAGLDLPTTTARWLFAAVFVAFAVQVPLCPRHSWLPDAHTEAPTAGSVLLAAVLLKLGAYGLVRFNLGLFPDAAHTFATAIQVLAVIGIVYGAVVAIAQTDLKRLIAYSSVSHLGFVVIGIFAFTPEGMAGGVLQMVNHGLSTGALFLLVGMVYERTHTRDLGELGGTATTMPLLSAAFLVAALSSVGLPGLNNFVGEFLVVTGTFAGNRVLGALAASGVVLAAIYLLWAYQRLAQGAVPAAHAALPDLSRREKTLLVPVLALMLVFGLAPRLLLDRIQPSADRVLAGVVAGSVADGGSR